MVLLPKHYGLIKKLDILKMQKKKLKPLALTLYSTPQNRND